MGARFFYADRQTDIRNLIFTFRNFANTPQSLFYAYIYLSSKFVMVCSNKTFCHYKQERTTTPLGKVLQNPTNHSANQKSLCPYGTGGFNIAFDPALVPYPEPHKSS
jgi:hypothetical protein